MLIFPKENKPFTFLLVFMYVNVSPVTEQKIEAHHDTDFSYSFGKL